MCALPLSTLLLCGMPSTWTHACYVLVVKAHSVQQNLVAGEEPIAWLCMATIVGHEGVRFCDSFQTPV